MNWYCYCSRKLAFQPVRTMISSSSESLINAAETVEEKRRTSQRKREQSKWYRNVLKTVRMEGKAYKTQKGKLKESEAVAEVKCHCHYKCNDFISNEIGLDIFNEYYDIKTKQ